MIKWKYLTPGDFLIYVLGFSIQFYYGDEANPCQSSLVVNTDVFVLESDEYITEVSGNDDYFIKTVCIWSRDLLFTKAEIKIQRIKLVHFVQSKKYRYEHIR